MAHPARCSPDAAGEARYRAECTAPALEPGGGRPRPRLSFSLIELLASTVILSILAIMAVPYAQTAKDRQREIELKDGLQKIRRALDVAMVAETTAQGLDLDGDGAPGEDPLGDPDGDGIFDDDRDGRVDEDGPPTFPGSLQKLVTSGYLSALPRDPLSEDPFQPATWTGVTAARSVVVDPGTEHVIALPGSGSALCPTRPACSITGIIDVRTNSRSISLNGSRYDSW